MVRAVHYIIIIETHTQMQQMQRVQRVPKDIDFIVYRFIHRDIMKQVNSEYKRTIIVCDCVGLGCNNVCSSYIMVPFFGQHLMYNYRYIHTKRKNYEFIHDKWNITRTVNYQKIIETHKMQKVPKDIDFIVCRFIHRDIMKQLNSEYNGTVSTCDCEDISCIKVCDSCIYVWFFGERLVYNYRFIHTNRYNYAFIHDKRNNACGELPKNY